MANAQVNRQKCGAFLSALNLQLGLGSDTIIFEIADLSPKLPP